MSFNYKLLVLVVNFFTPYLLLVFIITGCNLEAIYKKKETRDLFCFIELDEPQSNFNLYEVTFYNALKLKLCKKNTTNKTFLLKWNIKKSTTELITAKNTSISRYEVILTSKFYLFKKKDSTIIYSDETYSKAAHNVLEDELFSTITSERASDNYAATNLVDLIFNKIYLFSQHHQL